MIYNLPKNAVIVSKEKIPEKQNDKPFSNLGAVKVQDEEPDFNLVQRFTSKEDT